MLAQGPTRLPAATADPSVCTEPAIRLSPAGWGRKLLALWQWPALLAFTLVIAFFFHEWKVASALFLAPLVAGLAFAFGGSDLKVSRKVTIGSQAVIGCVVARSVDASILTFVTAHWLAILAVIVVTGGAAILVALGLMRLTTLSGQTAAWGAMPGAAGVMVALAAEAGGDPRLVAFMQYIRLIVVLSTASVFASLFAGAGAHGTVAGVAAPVAAGDGSLVDACLTILLGAVGMVLGRVSRIPAGPLLVTALIGAVIHLNGIFPLAMPYWLLSIAYGAVGWFVGLQFDRAVLASALRNLPAMVAATLTLILLCGIAGVLLSRLLGVDLLTGYLATSPGAIDSIAIIALGGKANMSVVMAVQTLRFFAVIMMAPYLVKLVSRLGRGFQAG